MAQTITIDLTDSETNLMIEMARTALGQDATAQEMRDWATAIAKAGLREYLGNVKMQQIRAAERTAREQERIDFRTEFPPVDIPTAENIIE